jgi:2-keto-4-pentenoate hydratase/2-oxohepta-3-ene-1,7-dioic acid hydratase in catechol pathway
MNWCRFQIGAQVSHGIVEDDTVIEVAGTVWEDFSSADQIWDTATWIHELSKTTTLHPGDVLWMGTDGDMVPGDVIEVEISGIGTLRNPVVAET